MGPSKLDEGEEKKVAEEDAKKRKLNLQAVRAAVRSERNGDMFSEGGTLFEEKYLVSGLGKITFCHSKYPNFVWI